MLCEPETEPAAEPEAVHEEELEQHTDVSIDATEDEDKDLTELALPLAPPPRQPQDGATWHVMAASLGSLRAFVSALGQFKARRERKLCVILQKEIDKAVVRNEKRHARQAAALRRSERAARQQRQLQTFWGEGTNDYDDQEEADARFARELAGYGADGGGSRRSRRATRKTVDYSYSSYDRELDDADPNLRRGTRHSRRASSGNAEDNQQRMLDSFNTECVLPEFLYHLSTFLVIFVKLTRTPLSCIFAHTVCDHSTQTL